MVGIRCCIACKARKNKAEFLRIIPNENNVAVIDESQKSGKRGIYICKSNTCLERYLKMINKNKQNLKININTDSLKELLESLRMGE